MTESILFDFAATLLEKIESSIVQKIALAWGVESDLKKLKSKLSSIRAVLKDADDKRAKSRLVNDWILKVIDLMYDVDDLLDEFLYEDLQIRVVKSESVGRKVNNFFSHVNPLASHFKMSRRMKALRERFDDISSEMSKFHLEQDTVPSHVQGREMTESFVRPSDVVGRENDKEFITKHLLQVGDGETVSIISIVGMGGLGKTTLAKLVYDDKRVQDHFQLKIWVCVSDDFQAVKLAREIIKEASGANFGDRTDDQSLFCLRDTLRDKRFLLILDDVWNEDLGKWIELKNLLLEGATGSKIIVTSRSVLVASIMGSVHTHRLGSLSDEDCLSLFVKWAFEEGQEKQHPNLMEIGNVVVKRCGGVPLAVKTLGGLLYSNTDVRDWIAIRDHEIWKLEQHYNYILTILRLSYEKLPSHLKLCFSYCALFPKDYTFNSVGLVQFWMAQGLIRSSDEDREPEDIGNRYINELWSRSFFQDVSVNGFYIIFKMHDLVHDLALLISKDECLTMSTHTQSIPKMIRHVSFFDTDLSCEDPSVLLNQKRLQTILFQNDDASTGPSNSFVETCILRFKYMRALQFSSSRFEVLHHSIGNLKHLRLLSLGYNKSIKKLPKSICKLHNLQTLNLAGCSELEELPKDIGKYLISLRNLYITTEQTSLEVGCLPTSLRFLVIGGCVNLKSLGEEMQRLTALRTLEISNCDSLERLPRGLNCSTTLENLILVKLAEIDTMEFEQDTGDFAPLSLRFLQIGGLPKLEALPQWLLQGSADSLQKLVIGGCPKLSALPEVRMNHLTELEILDCPVLTNRCQLETGEDWPKIAHVPKITLDVEITKSPEN